MNPNNVPISAQSRINPYISPNRAKMDVGSLPSDVRYALLGLIHRTALFDIAFFIISGTICKIDKKRRTNHWLCLPMIFYRIGKMIFPSVRSNDDILGPYVE